MSKEIAGGADSRSAKNHHSKKKKTETGKTNPEKLRRKKGRVNVKKIKKSGKKENDQKLGCGGEGFAMDMGECKGVRHRLQETVQFGLMKLVQNEIEPLLLGSVSSCPYWKKGHYVLPVFILRANASVQFARDTLVPHRDFSRF